MDLGFFTFKTFSYSFSYSKIFLSEIWLSLQKNFSKNILVNIDLGQFMDSVFTLSQNALLKPAHAAQN